jgi:soluble lytic murein transglycosylase-like protein
MTIERLGGVHVSLHEAGALARGRSVEPAGREAFSLPGPAMPQPARTRKSTAIRAARAAATNYEPHTPIRSAAAPGNPDRWDAMLNRVGQKYNVPPLFLKAVMLAESGGRPDAVGDDGHSVGLFQLHDRGYGYQMGDSRFDPEVNADRAAQGLSKSWQAIVGAGYTGEEAIRRAYGDSFNPGTAYRYQGDRVAEIYSELLAAQG